jgi:hypothetical protein
MIALILLAPACFLGLLLLLEQLEERVVAPHDRATKILWMLDRYPADELEGHVAQLLDPFVAHRTVQGGRAQPLSTGRR